MMDTAGGMMNRVSEAIQSVTPESVKHMEDKVMEKVHSVG